MAARARWKKAGKHIAESNEEILDENSDQKSNLDQKSYLDQKSNFQRRLRKRAANNDAKAKNAARTFKKKTRATRRRKISSSD